MSKGLCLAGFASEDSFHKSDGAMSPTSDVPVSYLAQRVNLSL